MTVEVVLANGKTITPSFSPEHAEAVAEYYNEQVSRGAVVSWRVL